jgi:hypothetical protein
LPVNTPVYRTRRKSCGDEDTQLTNSDHQQIQLYNK